MGFLVYDAQMDAIKPADIKPANYNSTMHPELLFGHLPVWHDPAVSGDVILSAIRVLLIRITPQFPYAEINSAVHQIVSTYLPAQYSFVALGQSPKLVKWVLKRQGYNTGVISVSKVKKGVTPPDQFREYVLKKLSRLKHSNIALIDFVMSGESLVVMKRYVSELTKGKVVAVALGTGSDFNPVGAWAQEIDLIIKAIPTLSSDFQANKYKSIIARSKDMVDFATFPAKVKGGEVIGLQVETFKRYKSSFARAAELGALNLKLNDFLGIAEAEHSDSDDVVDNLELLPGDTGVLDDDLDELGW